jgi:hypothetical protein
MHSPRPGRCQVCEGSGNVRAVRADERGLGLGLAVGDVVPLIGDAVGPGGVFDEEAGFDAAFGSGVAGREFEIEVFHPDHAGGKSPSVVTRVTDKVGGVVDEEPAGFLRVVGPKAEVHIVEAGAGVGR